MYYLRKDKQEVDGVDLFLCKSDMLSFAGYEENHKLTEARDVADPWYTGDFDATYRNVVAGCEALFCRPWQNITGKERHTKIFLMFPQSHEKSLVFVQFANN